MFDQEVVEGPGLERILVARSAHRLASTRFSTTLLIAALIVLTYCTDPPAPGVSQRPSASDAARIARYTGVPLCKAFYQVPSETGPVVIRRLFRPRVEDSGIVVKQKPSPGTPFSETEQVTLVSVHDESLGAYDPSISFAKSGFKSLTLRRLGLQDLLTVLGEVGFDQVLYLPGGEVARTEVQEQADGHLYVKIVYVTKVGRSTIAQVTESVPPSSGRSVRIPRGNRVGRRIHDTYYWTERGRSIAAQTSARSLLRRLEWDDSCRRFLSSS